MSTIETLFSEIDQLCADQAKVTEESYRLTAEGHALDLGIARRLFHIQTLFDKLKISRPSVFIDGSQTDDDDLNQPETNFGKPWKIILAKDALAKPFAARSTEETVLFLSVKGFEQWVCKVDPFTKPGGYSPDFSGPTTIRIRGLKDGFGGESLWVLPLYGLPPSIAKKTTLPNDIAVHELVHINADELIRIRPRSWAMNWGELASPQAAIMCRLSAMVLSTCLVQEIRREQRETHVTLRGTKKLSLSLVTFREENLYKLLPILIEAVEWVYEERPETRLKLVMDRLSIDVDSNESLIIGIQEYITGALQQARDSYTFVILDRKDAYYKEMRELMKDMKSQADLYAAKVRELVSSLTRDILGILVLVGFSFVGKFDTSHLNEMLMSHEFSLLSKMLAIYLFLSCVLVMVTTERDASMAYNEIKKWLEVLKHYTSRKDYQDQVIAPIYKRRFFLFCAMAVIGCIYLILVLLMWNLPFVVKLLLTQ